MERAHQDVLRKNTVAIKRSLNPDDTVTDTLVAEFILSDDIKDEVERHRGNAREQAGILLHHLPRAGSKAWDVFISALNDSQGTGHKELAATLLESLAEYRRENGRFSLSCRRSSPTEALRVTLKCCLRLYYFNGTECVTSSAA